MLSESEQGGAPVFDAEFFEVSLGWESVDRSHASSLTDSIDPTKQAPSSPSPVRVVKLAAALPAASDDKLMMRRVEAHAKSYALKLDVVKQVHTCVCGVCWGRCPVSSHYLNTRPSDHTTRHNNQIEDFEIARRDHKRSSNSMYWMAFTLIIWIIWRAKGENTRYLDFFVRKAAAEQTYVRCLLEASPCLY